MHTTDDTAIAGSAIDDLPQLWDGFAKLVRAGLDVTAFGVQIMDLPPDYTTASHDESDTGQQELYVALRGAGAVVAGDERLPLDPEHLVRVDAGVDRRLTSGPAGLRVLCVGGVPGAPYVAPEWTG
jgi:mannose-6-phosphate isomerase-like protein (cupin superfamily)